jgi:hypothetical protein
MGWKDGALVINERLVFTTSATIVRTSEDTPATLAGLAPKQRLFVVAEKTSLGLVAKKIYLLPERIEGKDKARYPFMREPGLPGGAVP